MRISALELTGFRAFPAKQRFELDADAVIIVGPNGQGKTSFFDGILWAVAGRIPRLQRNDGHMQDEHVVSLYSSSGEARATVEFRDPAGVPIKLTRSFDGVQQHLTFEEPRGTFREDAARLRLVECLWPNALVTSDSQAAIASSLTRSVYLQQDLLRQFIEADSEQERFTAVSDMVGAGRVTELQAQLERAKLAWTRATNAQAREGEVTRARLRDISSQISQLQSATPEPDLEVESLWREWWAQVAAFEVSSPAVVALYSQEASAALDSAVKQLITVRRAVERRADAARELLLLLEKDAREQLPDLAELRRTLDEAERKAEAAKDALAKAVATGSASIMKGRRPTKSKERELQTFAQLALHHLGDRCPVCNQPYDRESTQRRLEQLGKLEPLSAVDSHLETRDLEALERALHVSEAERVSIEHAFQQAERRSLEKRLRSTEVSRIAQEFGLDHALDSGLDAAVIERVHQLETQARTISELERRAERIALSLARTVERTRRTDLEQELAVLKNEVEELDRFLTSRHATGELAARMIEALRDAASDVVTRRLEQIEPLLQRIYARTDPHPAFRVVRFLTKMTRGKGRLVTAIEDSLAELETEMPAAVLSSSQMNALAVAVFLSFNLGLPGLPLSLAMLDDPLQSLDEINLLGAIDLLRRTKDRRQLFVSTHDMRFGRLIERKLRPVTEAQRTRVIELDNWTREGPTVTQREVAPDLAPLRIVA